MMNPLEQNVFDLEAEARLAEQEAKAPLIDQGTTDRLLEMMTQGTQRLDDLARAGGLSNLKLAQGLTQASPERALRQVAKLQAMQRDLLLGQFKLSAMMRLAALATDDESMTAGAEVVRAKESQRKACVDLIKSPFEVLLATPKSVGPSGAAIREERPKVEPASEATMRRLLDRLGEHYDAERERKYQALQYGSQDSPASEMGTMLEAPESSCEKVTSPDLARGRVEPLYDRTFPDSTNVQNPDDPVLRNRAPQRTEKTTEIPDPPNVPNRIPLDSVSDPDHPP